MKKKKQKQKQRARRCMKLKATWHISSVFVVVDFINRLVIVVG